MLFGCGINFPALRNCESSGMAYFDRIPLASRSEHEQAQRFTPLNNGNCLLYVVRKIDWWTGSSSVKALITLAPAEPFRAVIDATHFDGNVYAMWELPPSTYHLSALLYKSASLYNGSSPAQVEVDCRPGSVRFIAVGDRGFFHNVVLEDLTEEEGRTFVKNGIRSVGLPNLNSKTFYKYCP